MQGRKKFRGILLSSLLGLLALIVAACGSAQTPSNQSGKKAADDKQVFRYSVPIVQDFRSLDPAHIQSTTESYPVSMIFTGLVALDNDAKLHNQLAESYQISEDGLTYTFTLKKDLKFSNGDPLTAQELAWSINRAIDPATASEVSGYLSLIEGYEDFTSKKEDSLIGRSLIVKDPQTLIVKISKPAAYFLQTLVHTNSFAVNPKLVEKYGTSWTDHLEEGAGAGPFKVEKYTHSKSLIVVPNENYYGPKPQLKRVELLFSGDTDATYKSYKNGQYDYAQVPAANIKEAEKRDDFTKTPLWVTRYITMNYKAKPFDNQKIRQAFAIAVNKDLIVQTILNNAVVPASGILPPGMPGYDASVKGTLNAPTKGDRDQAVKLFEEGLKEEYGGDKAKLPKITLTSYTGNTSVSKVVTAVADQWSTIFGIKVETNLMDANTFTGEIDATFNTDKMQMWLYAWAADYPDPQNWLSTFFAKGSDYNDQNYGQNESKMAAEQQKVQQTMEQADTESDQNKRLELYKDAHEKILTDAGWIPLYHTTSMVVINPKLQGYPLNPMDQVAPDDWSKIYMTE